MENTFQKISEILFYISEDLFNVCLIGGIWILTSALVFRWVLCTALDENSILYRDVAGKGRTSQFSEKF